MSSQFTKETQSFPQGVKAEDWGTKVKKEEHFWQEVVYRGGCISFGKYCDENYFNFIAVF